MLSDFQFIIYYILTANEGLMSKIFWAYEKNHGNYASEFKIKSRVKENWLKSSFLSKLIKFLTITVIVEIKHWRLIKIHIKTGIRKSVLKKKVEWKTKWDSIAKFIFNSTK